MADEEKKPKAKPKAKAKAKPKGNTATQFKKGGVTQPRGKAFKTKIFEVIAAEAMLDIKTSSSTETAERAFLKHWAKRAFDLEDKDNGMLFKALGDRMYPALKSALPEVNFDLPDDASPAAKAEAVFKAVSNGSIPPDVGNLLIQAAKSMTDIEANTELKERIEKIEALLGKA